MRCVLMATVLALIAAAGAFADDPATFDQRYAVVATDSSGYGGPIIPFQGPQYFEPLRTAWWYNYTPYMNSQHVPGLRLFWPGYQRLYMYWKAVITTSDATIQQHAHDAKAADPGNTIWYAMSNEPNDINQANQTGASFAAIYLKHHKNLRIGDPTCKIMGPGLLNWTHSSGNTPTTGKAWYEEFRSAWAANPDCVAYSQSVNGANYPPQDAFSLHSYDLTALPDDWQYCRDELIACHNDLQTYPETQGLKMWNTEWGSLRPPSVAQAADMMGGLALWMREQPWMEKWFLFYTHDDKYSFFTMLNLFDDNGAITQLGKGYRDLSLLPMDASFYHVPFHATWDQGADYVRSGWTKSTSIVDACNSPGYRLYLTNGVAYTANSMRGRTYTPASGYVYRVKFNYLTNYDNNFCYLAMDTPAQTGKWMVDTFGVSTDYIDIDLSSDPVAGVSFGLNIRNSFTYAYTTGDWRGVVSNLMLLTCPYPPVVTDAGATTLSATTLSAQWTQPTGGKQPITEYQYAIGTTPKGADVANWTSAGSTSSFARSDLSLADDVTYYISVRAKDSQGNWGGIGCSDGIKKVRAAGVNGAKLLPLNTYVGMAGKVVSGLFADGVYVQEPGRCGGIRVMGLSGVQVGDVISVLGNVSTDGKEAVLKNPVVINSTHGDPPSPVMMNNRSTGGGTVGLQGAPVDDAIGNAYAKGANPIGLLVRTAGTVSYVDPGGAYAYVNDGSNLTDGSGQTGVRMTLQYCPVPALGASAVATGCLGATDIGGRCARLLRPRSGGDVEFSSVANYLGNCGFEAGVFPPWSYAGAGGDIRSGTWNGGITAHSGSKFFGAYAYNSTCSGVLTQTVSVPNGSYTASAWSRVFHTYNDPNAAANRIGIDPTGGTDPLSPNVQWSNWDTQSRTAFSEWHEVSTPEVAVSGNHCSVFLQYSQQFPQYHHMNCFDDAKLLCIP